MSEPLKTRIVFIDTQVYRSQNFNVTNSVFSKFIELCQDYEFSLLITDITKNEVYSNIAEQSDELNKMMAKCHKKSSHLDFWQCVVGDKKLFELSREDITQKFIDSFERYLEQSKAKSIPVYGVNAEPIFEKYFKKLPPFGAGKKKDEFPDAFVLLALEKELERCTDGIYVISDDADMAAYCKETSKLYHLESLKKLLVIYNSHQDLTGHLMALLGKNEGKIIESIWNDITDRIIYLSDEDGEVSDIELIKLEVDNEFSIIDISDSEATVEVDFKALLSGIAVYDDPDMGYYDKEEDRYHSFGTIEKEMEFKIDSTAEIYVGFDADDSDSFDLISITVNGGNSFFVDVHPPDDYYK